MVISYFESSQLFCMAVLMLSSAVAMVLPFTLKAILIDSLTSILNATVHFYQLNQLSTQVDCKVYVLSTTDTTLNVISFLSNTHSDHRRIWGRQNRSFQDCYALHSQNHFPSRAN